MDKFARTFEEISAICKEAGWKCTPQRAAVYEYICDNLAHPDVDQVWAAVKAKLPSVTRESVYRILDEFAREGVIRRLDQISRARYDSLTGPHGHFICERCGKIVDFALPEDVRIPPVPHGKVRHVELRLNGVCNECQKKGS